MKKTVKFRNGSSISFDPEVPPPKGSVLMETADVVAMLRSLPATCVLDAIKNLPNVSVNRARAVLYNLEDSGIVVWQRGENQTIQLTEKGKTLI